MLVAGTDPGPTSTGLCVLDTEANAVYWSGEMDDMELLSKLREPPAFSEAGFSRWDKLFVETIAPMGLAVGASTLETMRWVGRFQEAWERTTGRPAGLVYRGDEKIVLVGKCVYKNPVTGKVKAVSDSEIRRALIQRFPGTGGGSCPQVGTKKSPGPLYGVKGHAWSALAVLTTGMELEKDGRKAGNV